MIVNLFTFRSRETKDLILLIVFGITIGYLFGYLLNSTWEDDVTDHIRITKHEKQEVDQTPFQLRCLIIIHRRTAKPEKVLSALSDGYTKLCNETMYFTSSDRIMKKFGEEYKINYINRPYTDHFYWDFYQAVIEFSAKNSSAKWTFVGDDQTYLIVPNLQKMLAQFDHNQSIVFGKVVSTSSAKSIFFPFSNWKKMAIQGGTVLTKSAIQNLAKCQNYLLARETGWALYDCSLEYDTEIVDPHDEDSMRLFNDLPPGKVILPEGKKKPESLSDHAVSFGQLSIQHMRVIEYGIHFKVFGRGKIERVETENKKSINETSNFN